ncbi:unnamed protein product [Rotaria sordida]|uniref:Tetratricopeptide repeat protein n=1 Tax=Rotaria sordida TaxID=392033 RepID=A0A814FHS4_9BILA|nr:unnamed protein product [Rotaria sordida]
MGASCTRSNTVLPINAQAVSTVGKDMNDLPGQAFTTPLVPIELNENLEDFTVIWLDAGIDTSSDCIDTKQHLLSIINYLKTFTDSAKCIDYIKTVKEEKVFLIVSGAYGEDVVSEIENLPQIRIVYVFCQNAEKHKEWVSNHSIVQAENEVLIAMGSTFVINKVEQDEQGIWNVNLAWANKEDVELLAYMKKSLGQSTNLEILGSVLIDMGEIVKAERYFKLLLEQLPADHPSIGNIYLQMNTIGLHQSNIEKAIEYLEKAGKAFQMSYPTTHSCYGSLHFNMGRTQLSQCDIISAQLNLEKAIELFLKTVDSNNLKLAAAYVQSETALRKWSTD